MKQWICKFTIVAITLLLTKGAEAQMTITTFAGTGTAGYSGDGGQATAAQEIQPMSLARDAAGNIYIGEGNGCVIRKVNVTTGIITTVAGTGGGGTNCGYAGDGGPATAAKINGVLGMTFDASDNLVFADFGNHRIRKIDAGGTITTIAGTGTSGFSGDLGAATAAQLNYPMDVKFDATGNMYICDRDNYRIRAVTASTGSIYTITGNGTAGYTGDGGLATAATIGRPYNMAFDAVGNLYFIDNNNNCVRKINHSTGIISTVVGDGTGTAGFTGDGGPATAARLSTPTALVFDIHDNMYISDRGNQRIRRVSSSGIIDTVIGNGTAGHTGDGGPALAAEIQSPFNIIFDLANNLYIAEANNNDVRKVTPDPILSVRSLATNEPLLFPNPNAGTFTLNWTDLHVADGRVNISITNMLGQVLYCEVAENQSGLVHRQMAMSWLPTGVYLLHLQTGTNNKVIRFAVQR